MGTTNESNPLDGAEFRRAMSNIPTSVVVAGAIIDDAPVGMIVGTFTSVSLDPPLVGFFGDKGSATLARLVQSESISFSLLPEHHGLRITDAFRRPLENRYDGLDWEVSPHQTPTLRAAILTVSGRIVDRLPAGDHDCILAEVSAVDRQPNTGRPLVFFRRRLCRLDPAQLLDEEMWQLGWHESA